VGIDWVVSVAIDEGDEYPASGNVCAHLIQILVVDFLPGKLWLVS
jgi:hypothetical protein